MRIQGIAGEQPAISLVLNRADRVAVVHPFLSPFLLSKVKTMKTLIPLGPSNDVRLGTKGSEFGCTNHNQIDKSTESPIVGVVIGTLLFQPGYRFNSGRVELTIFSIVPPSKSNDRVEGLAFCGMIRADKTPEGEQRTYNPLDYRNQLTETANMREHLGNAAKHLVHAS